MNTDWRLFNKEITSIIRSRVSISFIKIFLLFLVFLGRRSITPKKILLLSFISRNSAPSELSSFDVSLITHSGSLNRKLFCVVLLQRLWWRATKSSPNGSTNKMRTNYSCQIDIVKQFIIGSMSPHVYLRRKWVGKRRSYETETRLNWWFNNIFLSFCMFFLLEFFVSFRQLQPIIKSFHTCSDIFDGSGRNSRYIPASLSLTAKAAAGCSGNAWWSAKGL